MSCNHEETLLDRYLYGELTAELHTRVERTLQSCEHCQRYVTDIENIRQTLQTSTSQAIANAPLDTLWESIREKLPEGEVSPTQNVTASWADRVSRWWGAPALEWALGGAVAAVAVLFGLWAIQSPPGPATSTDNITSVSHEFVVESYEITEGTVIIDVDPQQDMPAIVWHFVDDEEDHI